jgi:polynucleotide 5'-kinase involved in rRNA processing
MGIHHTYKSQRGERSLQKQQKQEERQRRAQQRQRQRQQQTEPTNIYVVPENEVITLDTLTNPNKK